MINDFNIDFHCHAYLRATNCAPAISAVDVWKNTQNYRGDSVTERWVGIRLSDMAKQSQSNLSQYVRSNTRIIFDSLYPLEKGWLNFRRFSSLVLSAELKRNIFRIASGITPNRFETLMHNPSYFDELEEVYKVMLESQGLSPDTRSKVQLEAGYADVQKSLKQTKNLIVIPSIEGGHALGTADYLSVNEPLDKRKRRVAENIRTVKNWEYPPFFIGLAHHFWNQLCGHAKSLKRPINFIVDQRIGLNQGITELGWHVIQELLTRKNGRRILLCVKHMSIKSRVQYYQFVQRNNHINQEDPIPIICSHTGVNGFSTIDRMAKYADSDRYSKFPKFNNLGINLCAEEIRIIGDSGGIVGLILDKVILGSASYLDAIQSETKATKRKQMYLELIWDTVFFIVNSVGDKTGWNVPVFSSDFDGLISQIECYNSGSDIQELRSDMLHYLTNNSYNKNLWFGYSPEEIIYKLFCGNVMEFLSKHYRY
ncbi:hypothetical protein N9R81_02535 [Flavobacteriales bacterium]|nr:hypothetical protein [Flavobacteriales bacterium]